MKSCGYDTNERGFLIYYKDEERQLWFETLQKISKFEVGIYDNLVTETQLKSFGIRVEIKQAKAWSFQAHNHYIYFLYDIRDFELSEKATEKQKLRYNEFISKLNRKL